MSSWPKPTNSKKWWLVGKREERKRKRKVEAPSPNFHAFPTQRARRTGSEPRADDARMIDVIAGKADDHVAAFELLYTKRTFVIESACADRRIRNRPRNDRNRKKGPRFTPRLRFAVSHRFIAEHDCAYHDRRIQKGVVGRTFCGPVSDEQRI